LRRWHRTGGGKRGEKTRNIGERGEGGGRVLGEKSGEKKRKKPNMIRTPSVMGDLAAIIGVGGYLWGK